MPERGEVWQVDFGVVAKVRPAHDSRPWLTVRGRHAGPFSWRWGLSRAWRPGLSTRYFIRRLGILTPAQMAEVEAALLRWLGIGGH